jgi:hypothetical protein
MEISIHVSDRFACIAVAPVMADRLRCTEVMCERTVTGCGKYAVI